MEYQARWKYVDIEISLKQKKIFRKKYFKCELKSSILDLKNKVFKK